MIKIDSILKSLDDEQKQEFITKVFEKVAIEVNQILLFGPSNKSIVDSAMSVYQYNKNRQFPVNYTKAEKLALPAGIAMKLKLLSAGTALEWDCEHIVKTAYLYGTGTCETFALVGAYILAQHYGVELSIESILSDEVHTYIRLHTSPEYIMDFWTPICCEYKDTMSWNECVDFQYRRKVSNTLYKTELYLKNDDFSGIEDRVFSQENEQIRLDNIAKVRRIVSEELFLEDKLVNKEASIKTTAIPISE